MCILELLRSLREGRFRPTTLLEEALERAREIQERCNAFVLLHTERARREARVLEALPPGARGPLWGLPVVAKDNVDEAGVPCSAGSAAYRERRPARDAPAVERLKRAGALVIGRANMHELADGVTSANPHHGDVRNPWDPALHPGGSSGGSAAAVALGLPAALGTDTGGSIRIPAALCGVVGLKPSRGLVPTEGVLPLSPSLDHLGPLAPGVRGAALLLEVLAAEPGLARAALEDTRPWRPRLGVLSGFGPEPEPDAAGVFEEGLRRLEAAGARLVPVELPALAGSLSLLSAIYAPEAAAVHREVLERRPGALGEEVRRDLLRGLRARPGRREAALAEAASLAEAVDRALDGLDALVSPTTPLLARPHGAPAPHRLLLYTCAFDLTGHPALSLPAGLSAAGLPGGLQLVGRRQGDASLLALGRFAEQALGFDAHPPGWRPLGLKSAGRGPKD